MDSAARPMWSKQNFLKMPSVLFVCLGNICRSPAAEGMLRHMAAQQYPSLNITAGSCGLGDWHKGQLPDARMRSAALQRGIVLASRARAFHQDFFTEYDYILAADRSVLVELYKWAESPEQKSKVHLVTAFSEKYRDQEIPDPYYCEELYFDLVLDMLEDSCHGLLLHILKEEESK